jgi:hypothetical protein
MSSQANSLVINPLPIGAEEEGVDASEHVQEHRARTVQGHGNGNSSRPPIADLWAGSDLYRGGLPDPSVDLQPDNPLRNTRSHDGLNAAAQTRPSAPTLATLRRLTIRATPLSLRQRRVRRPGTEATAFRNASNTGTTA